MKHIFRFLVFLFLLPLTILKAEQQEQELTGIIISYDQCNEQSNPVRNAFDGNINTYFNSCPDVIGNWIGLDLGEKHIITKVAYCPRLDNDYRHRLRLGIFEGANNPDFGDAIPLFIIPGLTERELTQQVINCSRAFRYVRFVFPTPQESGKSSYMAELKFYGYKGSGDDSQLPCITNLPTISIHTVNNEDITSKEIYVKGIVSVISADGKSIYTDSLDIRGRGNNSWTHPKKPYRMKLYNKASLLGCPAKEKNWTLINNYGDKTLMRNFVGFDISKKMELPYTSVGVPVNVFLNGDFKGCYQMSDQVEVADKRVEVEKMKTTDIAEPNLSGGYLLEIDAYASGEPCWFTSNPNGMPVTIKYPKDDEIVLGQKEYIEQHFNKMVSAVNAQNYKDGTNGFRKYIDTRSFLARFLAVELIGNTDSYWSVYMYKKRNDDKFYSSPIWDMDLGFENDWRTYPINNNPNWLTMSTGSVVNGIRDMLNRMFSDEALMQEMKDIYSYYRNKNILSSESLLQVVDYYAAELEQSQQLNFTRWPIMNQKIHENPVIHGSYKAEVDNVRNYLTGRIAWMDNKLNYVRSSADLSLMQTVKVWSADGKLYIDSNNQPVLVEVFDMMGKQVVSEQVTGKRTIALNKGVYIVCTDGKKIKVAI